MKRSLLAAYFWGAIHHPEFRRCRWILRLPVFVCWQWSRWNLSLALRIQLRVPLILCIDYRVLDDYAKLVLNDPHWDDIPF